MPVASYAARNALTISGFTSRCSRSNRNTVRRLTPAAFAESSSDHSSAARAIRDWTGRSTGRSRSNPLD